MSNLFDVIVIGCGGIGSAATYYAAKQGLSTLGLEQFQPVHDRGSSHGQTRVIRKAYFEHPDYVPLLQRAYANWREFEEDVGKLLFMRTGLLEVGPEQGVLIQGVRRAALEHALPLENIDRRTFDKRFPGFRLPEDSVAIFEPDAGFLLVEECVGAYLQASQRLGATLRFNEPVIDWEIHGSHVKVTTESDCYWAQHLIVTAGAWASELLTNLGVQLKVLRKHLHWYRPVHNDLYQCNSGTPTYFFETAGGYFYGFPSVDERGIKVAQHSGGELVSNPRAVNRQVDLEERKQVEDFLQRHLPQVLPTPSDHAVCMYTMSPDEHFILDRHPEFPQVAFAAGLSGHGFKFASVLGELLVQLALLGGTELPTEFLRLNRFSVV